MRKFFFGLFMLILTIHALSAFGVSSPYWEGNPLKMEPGETKIINLNIQNLESSDIAVSANITEGNDIASITSEPIEIKAKTSNTTIPLEITLPSQISQEETRRIKVEFSTLNAEGGIAVQSGVSASFEITTEYPQKEQNKLIIGIILGIVLLSLILWLILRSKK